MDLQTKLRNLVKILFLCCIAILCGIASGFILYYGLYWLIYDYSETTLFDIISELTK